MSKTRRVNRLLILLIVILIIAASVFSIFAARLFPSLSSKVNSSYSSKSGTSTGAITSTLVTGSSSKETLSATFSPAFKFNETSALSFFQKLETPTGMLETFIGSNTIYLADDQALDYYALLKLNATTLADNVSSSTNAYGGLFYYWNPVFFLLDHNPPGNGWNFSQGANYSLRNLVDGYNISFTDFNMPPVNLSQYERYADRALYYSDYCLSVENYSCAVSAFGVANSYWNGYGFADPAYNHSSQYGSYKLALDLIVFKALMNNSNTQPQVAHYESTTITQVENVMSQLQGRDGGVLSNYEISSNDVVTHTSTNYENGEATSLFVLAK